MTQNIEHPQDIINNGTPEPGSARHRDKPLHPKEKNTLLTLIGVLLKEKGIDPETRGIAQAIAAMAQEQGITLSERTVREIIKVVPDAIERRTKDAHNPEAPPK